MTTPQNEPLAGAVKAGTPAKVGATTSTTPPRSSGPATGPLNRATVVLDPARGGADGGSRIGDTILEKDVTLSLAFRLRSLLVARGFTVVMTREDDSPVELKSPDTPLTLSDRAGIANHARAVACLLLHATGSGNGVHLYSSELDPVPAETYPLPWLTAQAAWVPQSQRLERQLSQALARAEIPLVSSLASVRPVDSLTCPAVVLELAPRGDDPASINDTTYQQHVAEAMAAALIFWQNAAVPPVRLPPPPPKPRVTNSTSVAAEAQP